MSVIDYVVIGLYAIGMIAVGSYFAGRVKSADDYLLAGRSMPPLLVGLSLFATLTSNLTYLALPGEMILNGPVIFTEFLSFPFAFMIVSGVLIPLIMRQPVTSGYELLESRLGLTGRLLGGSMFVALRIVWMASILFAISAKVVIPTLKLDPNWLPVVCLTLAVITMIYTVQGGLKAVLVTDATQSVLMIIGAMVSIGIITVSLGGFAGWWPDGWPAHWPTLELWPIEWQSTTGEFVPTDDRNALGAFTAMLVWMTCTAGSDQMAIQRYLSTRNKSSARWSFGIQLITTVVSGALLGLAGLAVLGYFQANPGQLPADWTISSHPDKLFPHFIVVGLPIGLSGLVIAAILSAAMSSLSSGMNSSSAVLVSDFIGRAAGRKMTTETEIRLARVTSVVVCIVAVALSLFVGGLAENLLELCMKVVNLLTAPIFVLFFLALFIRRATPLAAVIATVASVGTALMVSFGWEGIWFLWAPPASLAVGVITGTAASYLPRRPPPLDTPG